MALKPSRKKRGRPLFQVRDADKFGEEVVAIELDERIEIDHESPRAR